MSLLKKVLGNGASEELAEEMRGVLREVQQERERYQSLIESARESAADLQYVEQAGIRLEELEARLVALGPVAAPAGGRFTLRAERWRIDVSLRPAGADRRLELTITVTRPR